MEHENKLLQSIRALTRCHDFDELMALMNEYKKAFNAGEITVEEFFTLSDICTLQRMHILAYGTH